MKHSVKLDKEQLEQVKKLNNQGLKYLRMENWTLILKKEEAQLEDFFQVYTKHDIK